MHHSYEGLDREGGFSRVQMLAPLRLRDFRLLWSGMCVSLLGDGVFIVAMAWQIYALSNTPTTASTSGRNFLILRSSIFQPSAYSAAPSTLLGPSAAR